MHFLGFSISFALLLVASLFILVAVVTGSWWINENGKFKAGLWEQCYEETPCVSYGTVFDRSFKKLQNVSMVQTKEKLKDESNELDTVRGMAVFSLIVLGICAFMIGLFLYLIKSKTAKRISPYAQLAATALALISGITGLASSVCATNYEDIFGLKEMKLGGSWIALLLGNMLSLVTGLVILITLIHAKIQDSRTSKIPSGIESAISSKQNSRKNSRQESRQNSRKNSKVSIADQTTNFTSNLYHPYGSLQTFKIDSTDSHNGSIRNGVHVDENDNEEYKIPDVGDVVTSYQNLYRDEVIGNHGEEDVIFNKQHLVVGGDGVDDDNSDLTSGKLGDFSSEHLTTMNIIEEHDDNGDDNDVLTNDKRSTSFENILYAEEK